MSSFRTAFRLSLPVLGAYWFLGITYGLLAANMGYSICVPISMALLIYSGSVEFIALTLLLSTFHPLAAFVMAFMVGARHLFDERRDFRRQLHQRGEAPAKWQCLYGISMGVST